MSQIKIGWAEEEFYLPKPVSLQGQFAERISEYIEKPVGATAMAVEAGGEQMVLCSVDLVSVSLHLMNTVRKLLAGNGAGLDPMKVVVSATHPHTGPGYTGRGKNRTTMEEYRSFRDLFEAELPPD